MNTEIDAMLREVAEKLRYRCDHPKEQAWDVPGVRSRCEDCHGEGYVYPLRAECRHGGSSWEIRREDCSCLGTGWRPIALGPSTLEATAARGGWRLTDDTEDETDKHDEPTGKLLYYYAAGRLGDFSVNGKSVRYYDPTDADSITKAKLQAVLEVLR